MEKNAVAQCAPRTLAHGQWVNGCSCPVIVYLRLCIIRHSHGNTLPTAHEERHRSLGSNGPGFRLASLWENKETVAGPFKSLMSWEICKAFRERTVASQSPEGPSP